jgi:hypothetical protein
MNPNLIAQAFQIADSAARSDIECYCQLVRLEPLPNGRTRSWYDTADLDELYPREDLDNALRYLEQRGQLIRDPQQPAHVAFPRAVDHKAAA